MSRRREFHSAEQRNRWFGPIGFTNELLDVIAPGASDEREIQLAVYGQITPLLDRHYEYEWGDPNPAELPCTSVFTTWVGDAGSLAVANVQIETWPREWTSVGLSPDSALRRREQLGGQA